MYRLNINGQEQLCPEDGPLLPFLRQELGLHSVKNGCDEGVCGACTVLLDGAPRRACRLRIAQAAGRSLLTLEGLEVQERELYAQAFAQAHAVQCGFCTPGMILAAKALLDKNPDPTPAEIRRALRGNLCRCTGYQKIVHAVALAGQWRREGMPPQLPPPERMDMLPKALGQAVFSDDIDLPDMLYGSALRSPYPRAKLLALDIGPALACPGVAAVLTAADVPGQLRIGHLQKDYPVLLPLGAISRFAGDAVALVAAESPEIVEKAKALIRGEWQPMPGVFSPEESAAPDAPLLAEGGNLLAETKLRRGDVEQAFARAAWAVSNVYHLPATDHGFLEPETAVAWRQGERLTVYCGDQDVYQTRRECSEMLGLPPEQIRVQGQTVGGAFGGKEDMSVQHHAALLAWHTHRPVKVRLSRRESLQVHPKRHAMTIYADTACDRQGRLTGFRARILSDAGAYASLSGPVLQRACTHGLGPYRCDNVEITGQAWITNNPPGGAFRGFGVTQSCFAAEANLNQLAAKAGISPLDIRRINGIRPGDVLANGQIASADTAYLQTLEAIAPFYLAHPGAGIASAMKNSGLGVGVPDSGRCRLTVEDGSLTVYCSAACIGQGVASVLRAVAAQVSGLPVESIQVPPPDTDVTPHSGNTTASRQSLFSGEAVRRAALELRRALDAASGDIARLEGQSFYGEYTGVTDPFGSEKEHPVSHIAYSYATQAVVLDDQGRVSQVAAAHDLGRAILPHSAAGQIEGGAVMSLGYALREKLPLRQGLICGGMKDLGLLRADEAPPVQVCIVDNPHPSELALGAKGVGEIAAIPAAPAAQNAYYNRDGRFRTSLPLPGTPYNPVDEPEQDRD
ncbi:MAG: selenium-dependent xanthine dehydrogenase [Firmicutes bacterium]|nr:selenium-dependent xanthine dehydrogenase [Bacillota bacterium]